MSASQPMSTDPHDNSQARHWSRMAIASPILGVLGFVSLWMLVGLFLAAAGAVCGHLGRFHTQSGEWKGRGLATTGIVLGYGSMLLFPLLVLIASLSVPALDMWRSEQGQRQKVISREKAAELFVACEAYARANRNRYPDEWTDLSGRFISSPQLKKTLRSPYRGGKEVAFEIVPHDRPPLPSTADSVIVIQEIAPAHANEIAVVHADGSVRSLHNPEYESP